MQALKSFPIPALDIAPHGRLQDETFKKNGGEPITLIESKLNEAGASMMKTRGMLFADNDSSSILAQFRYHKTCFSATGRAGERRAQVKLSA